MTYVKTEELVRTLRIFATSGEIASDFEELAADRIEALERALVTARTALEQVEYVDLTADWSYCPWCNVRKGAQPYGNTSGHLFCERQQALTKIAGVGIAGAEPVGVQP